MWHANFGSIVKHSHRAWGAVFAALDCKSRSKGQESNCVNHGCRAQGRKDRAGAAKHRAGEKRKTAQRDVEEDGRPATMLATAAIRALLSDRTALMRPAADAANSGEEKQTHMVNYCISQNLFSSCQAPEPRLLKSFCSA